jgi:hypothetical protein
MKTQLQRPVSGKSHYTPEFKEEALAKWRQSVNGKRRPSRAQGAAGSGFHNATVVV